MDESSRSNLSFRCIHCLAPSPHLYRRFHAGGKSPGSGRSTGGSLKLTECHSCHQTVDPYCEREALLVALDLVLLRRAAFRHVLWNDGYTMRTVHASRDHNSDEWSNQPIGCTPSVLQYCVLSSMLQALLWIRTNAASDEGARIALEEKDAARMQWEPGPYARWTLQFLLQLAILVLSSYIVVSVRVAAKKAGSTHTSTIDGTLLRRLALAWVLPTSFYVLTLFLLTWETTSSGMVANRVMSSVLVTVYQCLAVQAVVDVCIYDRDTSGSQYESTRDHSHGSAHGGYYVWLEAVIVAISCRTLLFGVLLRQVIGQFGPWFQ